MIKGLHELTLSSFTGFVWKKPCKKKKARINYFDEQYKPRIYWKIFHRKKNKISKPFGKFYAIQNLKFSSSVNHGGRHFFKTLPPPRSPPLSPNYFTAAKAL